MMSLTYADMTQAQRLLMKYIEKKFVPGSVRREVVDNACVKITDSEGRS